MRDTDVNSASETTLTGPLDEATSRDDEVGPAYARILEALKAQGAPAATQWVEQRLEELEVIF
ncbi:MAG: hypothetical protein M3Y45_04690, partial [Actinomycetota bacterium]|nr:hypothetical protein [Actinomycetota bacterium]